MPEYRNILFDLDGTLTDSGEGIISCADFALKALGIHVEDASLLRKFVGPPLIDTFAFFGVPADRIEEAIAIYRDRYNNHGGKYQNRVYDGMEELLGKLKRDGFGLYVATSKPEPMALDIMEKFGILSYFDFVAGATYDHSRETKAEVLRYLFSRIGGKEGCVLVGDTEFDAAGAKTLGIDCIGVSWGYGTVPSMEKAGARKIVRTPEELYEALAPVTEQRK